MNMFPETSDLPQSATDTAQYGFGKSFLFDFSMGDFVLQDGKLAVAEDIEALKVWIEKILRTTRDEWLIYEGTSYGSRLDDLLVGASSQTTLRSTVDKSTVSARSVAPPSPTKSDDFAGTLFFAPAFIESELRREMEDALLGHPQITGVSIFDIERTTSGANVTMEVVLRDKRTDTIKITF